MPSILSIRRVPGLSGGAGRNRKHDFIRGVNIWNDVASEFNAGAIHAWIDRLPAYGINTVGVQPMWEQADITSTSIAASGTKTPTDANVTSLIQYIQSKGMGVIVRPIINLASDPTHYRGEIGTAFSGGNWTTWAASYQAFVNTYATIAQAQGVDAFCVAAELATPQAQEAMFRTIVAGIKAIYSGPLFNAPEYRLGKYDDYAWADLMDYLGSSMYPILTDHVAPTVAELTTAMETVRATLAAYSAANGNKQILFGETGYTNASGTNETPWTTTWTHNPGSWQEQADCFQVQLDAFKNQSWFAGQSFWSVQYWDFVADWDITFNPIGKRAGDILKNRWKGVALPAWTAPVVSDQFARNDSAVTLGNAESGQAWGGLYGTWGISGEAVYSVSDASWDQCTVETGLADFTLVTKVKGQVAAGANNRILSPQFRAVADGSTFLSVGLYSDAIYLYKMDGWSQTQLATAGTTAYDNWDCMLAVRAQGNNIKISVDGTQLIDYTLAGGNTKYIAYTRAGFFLAKAGAPTVAARASYLMVSAL